MTGDFQGSISYMTGRAKTSHMTQRVIGPMTPQPANLMPSNTGSMIDTVNLVSRIPHNDTMGTTHELLPNVGP